MWVFGMEAVNRMENESFEPHGGRLCVGGDIDLVVLVFSFFVFFNAFFFPFCKASFVKFLRYFLPSFICLALRLRPKSILTLPPSISSLAHS